MDEVVMGAKEPVEVADVYALVNRYSERIQAAIKQGKVLRRRVVDGEDKIAIIKKQLGEHAPVNCTWDDVVRAEIKLKTLKQELREHDALLCTGMGAALAGALGAALADFSREDGWQPPTGSVLRIYMPGLLNLSMRLKGR